MFMKRFKVLFLSNHFITLYAFRKELVQRVLKEGYEVYVSLPQSEESRYFETIGCHLIHTNIDRRGINPVKDAILTLEYIKMMKQIKPDIIFSYTIKPNIYGSIASRIIGIKQICNITGTGGTFLKNGVVSKICKLLYKYSVRYSYKVFFQNTADRDFFIGHGLVKDNYDMLPGSGVNLDEHPFSPLPDSETLNFLYIGRVMKLKGIEEFLECAKKIHEKYPNTTFYIAGWNEEPNYMKRVEEAQSSGYVEYLGFRKDIQKWIERCHSIIHPAHGGEGISNVMLECAAMGRVCIASDISGCREIVEDGVTGLLFEKENVSDLIIKVNQFIMLSDEKRAKMGISARNKVEREFDRDKVVDKYMNEIEFVNHV